MKRNIITFEPPVLHIPQGEIWMTLAEIAELFNTTATHIRHTIRAIYRSGVLLPYHTTRFAALENGSYDDVYNLDLLLALAYRIDSSAARQLRKKAVENLSRKQEAPIIFCLDTACAN